MIIKKLGEILHTSQDVDWGNGKSRRLLVQGDGLPYTITETTVKVGTASKLQYLNHTESCYCIDGEGEVEANAKVYKIEPGTLYAPEKDKHILRATQKDLKLVCVFTPPLKGSEKHTLSEDGFSTYSK